LATIYLVSTELGPTTDLESLNALYPDLIVCVAKHLINPHWYHVLARPLDGKTVIPVIRQIVMGNLRVGGRSLMDGNVGNKSISLITTCR
jgi:hypothetical protein